MDFNYFISIHFLKITKVKITSDYPFTEDSIKSFLSFTAEIAQIKILKSDEQNKQFECEVEIINGLNSVLCLDKSIYQGHEMRITLLEDKSQIPQKISNIATLENEVQQSQQSNAVIAVAKNTWDTATTTIKDLNQKFHIVEKTKKTIMWIPNQLLRCCRGGETSSPVEQTITQEQIQNQQQ